MLVSLDLGSRYCGVAILDDALPVRVAASVTLDVDREDVTSAADAIIGALDLAVETSKAKGLPPPRLIIEWGRFYVPAKETPQKTASAGAAMGEARDPMICIRDRCEQHAKALGIPRVRINAKTWRSRVGCVGRDDAAVSLALAAHVPLEGLDDEHQRDAAGAAIGVLIGERDALVPKVRAARSRSKWTTPPRVLARRAADAALDALCEAGALRIAAAPPPVTMALTTVRPCGCGARGRHRPGCPTK